MKIVINSHIHLGPFMYLWGEGNYPQMPDQTWITNLIGGLKEISGIDLHIVTESSFIPFDKDAMIDGVQYHFLRCPPRLKLATLYYFDSKRLVKKIEEIEPDLVHAHFNTEYHLAALKSGYPMVSTVHCLYWRIIQNDGFNLSFKVLEGIQKYTLRRSLFAICVSNYVEQQVKRVAPRIHTFVIPNAIDLQLTKIQSDYKTVKEGRILYIGGIQPLKNILLAIRAVPIILHRFPRCQLRLAGAVPPFGTKYFALLKDNIKTLGTDEHVLFLGRCNRTQIINELSCADVLVHPSFEETFGMAVVEAMGAGKPVVSTPVGAVSDLVEDGKTGFLISPKDVYGLADKVIELLSNAELRRRFGERSREIVIQQLNPRRVAEQHVAIYEQIVKSWK